MQRGRYIYQVAFTDKSNEESNNGGPTIDPVDGYNPDKTSEGAWFPFQVTPKQIAWRRLLVRAIQPGL